jgi:hypothetical protein
MPCASVYGAQLPCREHPRVRSDTRRYYLLTGHFAIAVMQPLQKVGDLPACSAIATHTQQFACCR